jgi:hypothetical protein
MLVHLLGAFASNRIYAEEVVASQQTAFWIPFALKTIHLNNQWSLRCFDRKCRTTFVCYHRHLRHSAYLRLQGKNDNNPTNAAHGAKHTIYVWAALNQTPPRTHIQRPS